jgi:hypothetical protein
VNKKSRHEKPLVEKEPNGESINNPNKITINQHVIPAKHLLEWSKDGKSITIHEVCTGKKDKRSVSDTRFCVMRLWDQWTESVMLKSNEDNYQKQIDLIKRGQGFTNIDHVTGYYILLCVRICVANKERRPNYPSMMTNLSLESTKAELEENELEMMNSGSCVHFVKSTADNQSQDMAREVVKLSMSQAFTQWCQKLKGSNWIIINSTQEDFVLSDAIYNNFLSGVHILPINPKQVLMTESTYRDLTSNNSLSDLYINNLMRKNAVNYYVMS